MTPAQIHPRQRGGQVFRPCDLVEAGLNAAAVVVEHIAQDKNVGALRRVVQNRRVGGHEHSPVADLVQCEPVADEFYEISRGLCQSYFGHCYEPAPEQCGTRAVGVQHFGGLGVVRLHRSTLLNSALQKTSLPGCSVCPGEIRKNAAIPHSLQYD